MFWLFIWQRGLSNSTRARLSLFLRQQVIHVRSLDDHQCSYLVQWADYLSGRMGLSFHLCGSPQIGSGPLPHQTCLLYCKRALQTEHTRQLVSSGEPQMGLVMDHNWFRSRHLSGRSPWRSCTAESYTKPHRQTSCTTFAWRTGCPYSCCGLSYTWRRRGSRLVLRLRSNRKCYCWHKLSLVL